VFVDYAKVLREAWEWGAGGLWYEGGVALTLKELENRRSAHRSDAMIAIGVRDFLTIPPEHCERCMHCLPNLCDTHRMDPGYLLTLLIEEFFPAYAQQQLELEPSRV
jgi:hypothetical protein